VFYGNAKQEEILLQSGRSEILTKFYT